MYPLNKAGESNWFSVKYRTRLIKPVSLQQVKTRVKYDLCFKGHEMQEYSAGGAAETTWKKCHVLAALIRDKRQNSELAGMWTLYLFISHTKSTIISENYISVWTYLGGMCC